MPALDLDSERWREHRPGTDQPPGVETLPLFTVHLNHTNGRGEAIGSSRHHAKQTGTCFVGAHDGAWRLLSWVMGLGISERKVDGGVEAVDRHGLGGMAESSLCWMKRKLGSMTRKLVDDG
ncbi:hypothetical protein FALCPG4_000105 [Fusarium falciforme]